MRLSILLSQCVGEVVREGSHSMKAKVQWPDDQRGQRAKRVPIQCKLPIKLK